MSTATFALLAGIAYLGAGVLGLLPVFLSPPPIDAPETQFTFLYGYLFGLFPVNVAHSAVHVVIGLWGITAAAGSLSPVRYARVLAVFYGVLAVFGMLPEFNTFFGLIPLHSHDVWLHGATAAVAAYFGWREVLAVARDRRGAIDRRLEPMPVHTERRQRIGDRRRGYGMNPV
ncbi:MAG: DUF4383 domain-containing protein [Betaproteobacteria bacterium]